MRTNTAAECTVVLVRLAAIAATKITRSRVSGPSWIAFNRPWQDQITIGS
jgi:hypothetical protein